MSDVLQYQGHFGSAEYSQADQVFFGKLLYIRALVTYESGTAKGLEKAFKEAVSDYLATAKQKASRRSNLSKAALMCASGETCTAKLP